MSVYLIEKGPYLLFAFLLAAGSYLLIAHGNLLKGIIGLYLFQTGIILFFITLAVRENATIPILSTEVAVEQQQLINPLPHALMLTAIVVGVATLGVALAILRRIYNECGHINGWLLGKDQ